MRKANSDAEIVHATGAWRYWPLRLVVFLVVLFGIYLGWKLLFAALAPHMHAAPETVLRAVWNLAGIPILVAAYVVLVKRTEKRAVRELAPADLARLLAIGALVGAALFAAVCAILLLAHAATFGPFNAGNKALAVAAAALIAAVGEEIVFRGGLYRLLEEGLGTWMAIGLRYLRRRWRQPGNGAASNDVFRTGVAHRWYVGTRSIAACDRGLPDRSNYPAQHCGAKR